MLKLSIPFDVKASGRQIEGHGSTFGNVDLGGDVMMPGAFEKTIAEHKAAGTMPAMLWQHAHDMIPGVWTDMAEDADGLSIRGEFADTQLGNEARTLARMKALRGLSIGYEIDDFDFHRDTGVRMLKQVTLWEVSLVTFPMNPQAVIETVKSCFPDPRSLEAHLREVGCTKGDAKDLVHDLLASGVRPADDRCEADEDVVKAIAQFNDWLIADRMRKLSA